MKRVTVLLAVLMAVLFSFGTMAALDTEDYLGGIYFLNLDQAVLGGFTSTGMFDLIGGARFDNVTSATILSIAETNIALTGIVSITGASTFYGATTGIGYDVGAAMSIATTDATGVMAITHAGSGPTMAWTIPVWTFTNSTSMTTYTPSWMLGYDSGAAMTIAVSDTTGNVTITQTGSNMSVTWTAAGGFDFVGPIALDATTISTTLGVTGVSTLAGIITTNGNGAIVADKATAVENLNETHKTTLTFTLTGDNDLDLADGDHGTGIQVYDFPAGHILILGATIDASVTTSANYDTSPNDVFVVSCGTEVGADDNALTGTEVDIIPSTELDTVGATALTLDWHAALAASAQFDGTGTAKDLYVNVACTAASATGANTYAITGTLTVTWINLGDY